LGFSPPRPPARHFSTSRAALARKSQKNAGPYPPPPQPTPNQKFVHPPPPAKIRTSIFVHPFCSRGAVWCELCVVGCKEDRVANAMPPGALGIRGHDRGQRGGWRAVAAGAVGGMHSPHPRRVFWTRSRGKGHKPKTRGSGALLIHRTAGHGVNVPTDLAQAQRTPTLCAAMPYAYAIYMPCGAKYAGCELAIHPMAKREREERRAPARW
jgi:hypothetical protein